MYSQIAPPPKLPGEVEMKKDPLRIILDRLTDRLDPSSRINLGKVFPIDHTNRVKSLGVVSPIHLPKLLHYVELLNVPLKPIPHGDDGKTEDEGEGENKDQDKNEARQLDQSQYKDTDDIEHEEDKDFGQESETKSKSKTKRRKARGKAKRELN